MISTRLGYTDPELCFGIHGINVLQRASTRGTNKNKYELEDVIATENCYHLLHYIESRRARQVHTEMPCS